MKIIRDTSTDYTIRGIGEGSLTIGETEYAQNIAVFHNKILTDAPDRPLSELNLAAIQPILDEQPEIILIGTGWQAATAPRELMFGLARIGIGLEVMDTPAAARTFNILIGEDRRPAALLYF